MKIINLTPHAINVLKEDGSPKMSIPASGTVARAVQMRHSMGEINGIPVNKSEYGDPVNLPAAEEGTVYIVSVLTAQSAPDRDDLLVVDDLVRNEDGQIIGCRAFARI